MVPPGFTSIERTLGVTALGLKPTIFPYHLDEDDTELYETILDLGKYVQLGTACTSALEIYKDVDPLDKGGAARFDLP